MSATVHVASTTLVAKRIIVMTIIVRPWMANELMPSWINCCRFSMSLVIRLIKTPAFSSVKKSRLSRWKWVKTRSRRSCITREAKVPVTVA